MSVFIAIQHLEVRLLSDTHRHAWLYTAVFSNQVVLVWVCLFGLVFCFLFFWGVEGGDIKRSTLTVSLGSA